MNIYEIIILGIIQGLTEFLPISSSGHLVIVQHLLDINFPGNHLEILFHIGTLLSVIFIFQKDIINIFLTINKKETQKLMVFLIVGTLPAMVIGLVLNNHTISIFDNIKLVAYALFFTGIILVISSKFRITDRRHTLFSSLIIGFSQAIAIIPGVSRSGLTISMALFLGFSPKDSARFSFLLSIPIILGAGLLGVLDKSNPGLLLKLDFIIIGVFSSFITGVIALKFLLRLLETGRFYIFGVYCVLMGISVKVFL